MSYSVKREWIVNTDGTEVVQNRIVARIILSALLNTSDGMQLPLNKSYLAYQLDSLPSDEVMIADVKDMITRLRALQQAPVANPSRVQPAACSSMRYSDIALRDIA